MNKGRATVVNYIPELKAGDAYFHGKLIPFLGHQPLAPTEEVYIERDSYGIYHAYKLGLRLIKTESKKTASKNTG